MIPNNDKKPIIIKEYQQIILAFISHITRWNTFNYPPAGRAGS